MTNGEKTMRTPASYRKRALFAVLAPVAAFAGVTAVSAISASGCIGGTDTIDDDDATTDTRDDETAIGGDGARVDGDAPKETSADSPDAGDTSVPTDTLGLDVPGTDGPDVVVADTRGADTPDVVVADTGGAGDTRLDVLDALDADVREVGDGDVAISDAAGVPSLGAASRFSVLGGSTVTSTGLTVVTGDLGVWPGLAVTGFGPGVVIGGTIDRGTAVSAAGQGSLTALYDALKGAACRTDMSGIDLSGKTLGPGVYCFTSSAAISTVGTLTLDAGGDPNAFWIFQIASTLTTPDTSAVNVINGGSACNVFWAVGSSATIGKSNRFEGNIVALDSITVQTGSNVSGRALARTGAVTLDTNAIGFTTCGGGAVTDAGIDASLDADTGTDASADADADAGDVGDGG